MSDGIQIVRSKHAQQYLILSNDIARDNRLSFRARGLHHYLLSLPEYWHTTVTQLGKENPEGRDAIYTAFAELIKFGYVVREKYQDERGHWDQAMTVYDLPQDEPGPENPFTVDPGLVSPDAGKA